jgi:hypothetical protein
MSKYICENCKTENEPEYEFCKNCGIPLNRQEYSRNTQDSTPAYDNSAANGNSAQAQADNTRVGQQGNASAAQAYGNHSGAAGFMSVWGAYGNMNFDGVSGEEMAAFVGKKANDILPKFFKMQLKNSKVSWCWPAAILGFIFGPLGSGLWFLYRKMYKIGIIFLAIGVVISIAPDIMANYGNTETANNKQYENYVETDGSFKDIFNILGSAQEDKDFLDYCAETIDYISSILAGVVAGMYGFYYYKKHCIEQITSFRAYQADSRFYSIGLASLGGVSGGALTGGIFVVIMIIAAISSFLGNFSINI